MAFVTVADLDEFLGATDAALYSAAFKATAVGVACSAIESYCRRTFAADDYREWYKAQHGQTLMLQQYPLLTVRRAAVGVTTAGYLNNTSTDATAATGSVANAALRLTVTGGVNAGDKSFSLPGYSTMALLAAAVASYGHGWVLTVENEDSPRALREDVFGDVLNGSTAALNAPGSTISPDIDYRTGALLAGRQGDVYVDYRAGYETIPDDLTGAALGLARDWLASGTATPAANEESKRLGDFTHTVKYGGADGAGGMIAAYKPVLDTYRRMDWGIL